MDQFQHILAREKIWDWSFSVLKSVASFIKLLHVFSSPKEQNKAEFAFVKLNKVIIDYNNQILKSHQLAGEYSALGRPQKIVSYFKLNCFKLNKKKKK